MISWSAQLHVALHGVDDAREGEGLGSKSHADRYWQPGVPTHGFESSREHSVYLPTNLRIKAWLRAPFAIPLAVSPYPQLDFSPDAISKPTIGPIVAEAARIDQRMLLNSTLSE